MTSPFYQRTHLFPPLPIQAVNVINIFRNDKKVYLQSKGWMPIADCQLATAIFILWLFLPSVNIINLVHMCLMLTEEGGSYELKHLCPG